MTLIRFYETVPDEVLKFAVIIARKDGKWIFCKHKRRDTYEIPGGHREPGEDIETTARRELYEETGALQFTLTPVCVYSVTAPDNFNGQETFGMLFFAQVGTLEGNCTARSAASCRPQTFQTAGRTQRSSRSCWQRHSGEESAERNNSLEVHNHDPNSPIYRHRSGRRSLLV